MARYLKWWRKINADVNAVAQESSSSDSIEDNFNEVSESAGVQAEVPDEVRCLEAPQLASDSYLASVEVGPSSAGISDHNTCSSSDSEIDNSDQTTHSYSFSDYEIEESSNSGNTEIRRELAEWALKCNCTRKTLNDLLAILRRHGHNDLPADARTLLQTPRTVDVLSKCGGQYAYFGIEKGISHISGLKSLISKGISLQFNIDGLPLFKSSNVQLWPIMCSINRGHVPFIVGMFCGTGKPSPVKEYLADFLKELHKLTVNGIKFEDKTYNVSVDGFVCDAPARAFLKCVKTHTGYSACERCTVHGSWDGRVVYNTQELFPLRKAQQFQNMAYEDHQIEQSPLTDIGILCIEQFALDYMHCVCLGVVRRILSFLKHGPTQCRQSARQISEISNRLVSLSGLMPSEFARQPRSLLELDRWKATELRQFLLYTGPVVLRDVVPTPIYDHFLCLNVAIAFMLDADADKRNFYLPYAKELLECFVGNCPDIYGNTFTVYNVHNLIHLHEDITFFQCSLNDISAFKYENHLQMVKKIVKKAQNPIAQIAKRLTELNAHGSTSTAKVIYPVISTRSKDNCFILHTEDFVFVHEEKSSGELACEIIGQIHMQNFFESPCNSKLMNIAFIETKHLKQKLRKKVIDRSCISRKVVCLPYDDGFVFFPLLHRAEKF